MDKALWRRMSALAAPWPVYLLALLPALTFFALLYAQPWLPMASLIRDPVAILGGQFYHGLVSNIGILLWCAAAAICLFRGFENRRAGFGGAPASCCRPGC